jgi:hypothetical protein
MMILLARALILVGKTMISRVKPLLWGEMMATKSKGWVLEKMMTCKVMEVI